MTPFDPTALLAMLLTFYPVVSVAALRLARAERPEYFAGGILIGTTGEKLLLPDGRLFDLMFDASNLDPARRRWQVIQPSGSGGADAPWPLEPGPFSPIDESAWSPPSSAPIFAPLVAAAYATLGDADGLFGSAASTLTAASSSAALDVMFSTTIGPAESKVDGSRNNLNAADPTDVILASGGQIPIIDANAVDFTEPAPPDRPTITGPIRPPRNPELD